MKPSEAKHIKINGGPPSAMTANFLCSVAEDMPLNEREARLLAVKFEATPCYAEYSALCAIAEAADSLNKRVIFTAATGSPVQIANDKLCEALIALAKLRS